MGKWFDREEAAKALNATQVRKANVKKAVAAILQISSKKSGDQTPLFKEHANSVQAMFSLSFMPEQASVRPRLIPLPVPMYGPNTEMCFICKDPKEKYKEMPMKDRKVPGLAKVISVKELRRKFASEEDRVKLSHAYDLFTCDFAVCRLMSSILGKPFFKKNPMKIPIPITIDPEDPAEIFKRVMQGTTFRVPSGPSLNVRIGFCSMEEADLCANAARVITELTKFMARNPLQSIHIKAVDTPALPVYKRPKTPGEPLDLKKYRAAKDASDTSDTERSRTSLSETEDARSSELLSDTGETLSTLDTVSEADMLGSTSQSELDSETGDLEDGIDGATPKKEKLPLVKGLKAKKRKDSLAKAGVVPEADVAGATKPGAADEGSMPPPRKKTKKAGGKAPEAGS